MQRATNNDFWWIIYFITLKSLSDSSHQILSNSFNIGLEADMFNLGKFDVLGVKKY